MYISSNKADNKIDSVGAFHLSKAEWPKLQEINLCILILTYTLMQLREQGLKI
jgi:hypothetical protein